ncbi:MAG TPA: alpha/beta hydrolase domain-containing protein [Candidatus Binatia bacterium]|nr:alpha/beta hydrolase domain-containing protein [Candidatus Binatia bacterium]
MDTIQLVLNSRALLLPVCLALVVTVCMAVTAPVVNARITRLEILSIQSPTFGGLSFGTVGTYEKIFARAYGEVDPSDRRNALTTDIHLAPRNASGKVEYSTDVHIIKPVDMSKGNGRVFYEVVNRGNKDLNAFNGAGGNNPTTAADAGTGLLMRLGYTMVWSGWEDEGLVAPGGNRALARLPIARNPNGSSVVEQTITEVIFDNATGMNLTLTYRAANLDQTQAKMLVHNHTKFVGGPLVDRVVVPTTAWSYVNDTTVRINRADPFLAPYDQGAAYEFVYPAKDPQVLGLGLAATRDVVSFLRHDTSTQNPLRGGIQYVLAYGQSQSGRYLKGFTYWGFNEDEAGQKVFDGILPKISGAHAIASNDRFGDTNATGRSYQRHLSAKQEFPFTYEVRFDPISGLTDGIFARCQVTSTCPKVAHMDSGNEAYLKPTALVTTDGLGHDIALPANVRVYYVGSSQHGPSATPNVTATCQQLSNPNQHSPHLRALFVALDDWATHDVAPPASRYAKISDGTLVPSLPQVSQGFPVIPGVNYTGWYNPVDLLDKSVLPNMPIPGKSYTVLVPKTDADGNDIAGIRTVNVQVPLATYTGWALRRAPFAEGEDCALTGQYIPFAATKAERLAKGDPRLSVEERYRNHGAYMSRVAHAVNDLVRNRLLLEEDGEAIKDAASNSAIGH